MGYQNLELHLMNADGSNSRSLTTALDESVGEVQPLKRRRAHRAEPGRTANSASAP